jgi:hypothetical protein
MNESAAMWSVRKTTRLVLQDAAWTCRKLRASLTILDSILEEAINIIALILCVAMVVTVVDPTVALNTPAAAAAAGALVIMETSARVPNAGLIIQMDAS